eukprot:jgi/Psemu1/25344/gm1.25344_g
MVWVKMRRSGQQGGRGPGKPASPSQPMFKGRCEYLEGQTYGANVCRAVTETKCIKSEIEKNKPTDPGKDLSEIKLVMEKEKARRYIT